MRIKKHILSAAILVPLLFTACETVQQALSVPKPSARMTGLKFDDITVNSATLLFDVEVENPYPVALPLVNIDYGLASRERPLLSGKADLQSTVPAKSKMAVSLPATITYWDLINAFKDIRPGSKIPYKANLGLSVDTPALGVIRLPINKKGELYVPAIPKTDDIDWKKLLLDKAVRK